MATSIVCWTGGWPSLRCFNHLPIADLNTAMGSIYRREGKVMNQISLILKNFYHLIKKAKKAIDWQWFTNVWENGDRYDLYEVWEEARRKLGSNEISFELFDMAYQLRNPFHPKKTVAKKEFLNMVIGFY